MKTKPPTKKGKYSLFTGELLHLWVALDDRASIVNRFCFFQLFKPTEVFWHCPVNSNTNFFCSFVLILILVCFVLRQGFSVALEPIMELALVDQASLELTEICLSLLPGCWD